MSNTSPTQFNEDLCQQVRDGKLAIKNTDRSKLIELCNYIRPGSNVYGIAMYYWINSQDDSYTRNSDNKPNLPALPVSSFFTHSSTEGKEEDPTVKSDVEEKKEGDITRYPTDEETIEVYSGMFDNNQPQSFIEENNPQNFELKEAKELIKGSNEDLAIEVTARFAGKSGGKNGRWKEPMKKQFIDGALWMRERLK